MSKVNSMKLLCFVIVMQILNCQTYLNYVNNGNFQNNTCTSSQLNAQYSCLLSGNGYSWYSNYSGTINLQYGYNFYSTSSSSIVASLDFYSGSYYHQNYFYTQMHPITVGTYRLTFTAYTRKTGTAAGYYFSVLLKDYGGYNYYINNKTYQFNSLGSMPITETITISSPPTYNYVQLSFYLKPSSSFTTPFAVGISDVKFERTSACNSNETSVVLATGETACILNHTIQSVNYCTSWNYYHWYQPTGAYYAIQKFYSCSQCSAGKLVGVRDDTISSNHGYNYHKYGCTINQIPNTLWYRRLMIQNQNGKYFYTTYGCNGSSSGYLIVPNVSFSGYDTTSGACGISSDAAVTHWQVANSAYYPAICSASGYFPVITSSTSRVCQLISSPITNCAIYLADFKCASCSSNATSITWNNSGTLTNLCVTSSQQVYNCITYVVVSGAYVCSTCDTGFTLSTLNSVKVCMRNDLIDGNCTTYALNANKNYECTVCGTGFTLSTVNTTAGQIKRCLSTTTQIIKNCLVYEGITGGYGCYQCSAAANIARYLFTFNGLSAYRCLNTLTEYIANCGTYDFVSSLYKCSACSTSYLLANVTINSVVQLKCLATATQVVSNCAAYGFDGSSNYICSSCATGYTSKTISNIPKCLPDIVIDAQCTTYILNGSNFECSACNSLYTVSSVFTNSATYKYCLLTTALIRDCSVYESISGGSYQCNQCLSQPNIARYTFLLDGVQAYRCLNSAMEYVSSCSTYHLTSQIYTCTTCSTGYEMKNIMINSVSQPRCLNSLTQIVSSCTAYVTDPTNEYVCNSCSSSYTLKTVSGVPKCLPDIVIDAQCTTYILNGSNFECSACDSGNNLRTVSGVPKCIPDAETIDKCTNYTLETSGQFSCSICDAGYTLKPLSGVNKCLPDKVIDPQCTTYIFNGNSFECSQCNSLYSLQNVFKNAEIFKNCLLTSSEVIRDCDVYEINSQKYECKQCSSTQNIARSSFTFDGYQTHRCLNSLTEYVEFCMTYQLSSQVYSCTLCETAYQRSDVTVNQAEKVKCLTKANEVVQDCKHYAFDSVSSIYSCDQCEDGFTLKTDSDSDICVHDDVVQDDCIQYKDNGDMEVCIKCQTSFTLSDVTVGNVLTVQCLSNEEEFVAGCKKYEQVSLSYDCTECQISYSRETVVIHAKSTFRCLLQDSEVVEDCLAYSVNSDEDFVCNSCSTGFSLQNGISHEKVCSHNENVQSHCIQYKDNGVIEVCTKCQTLFQLGTVTINGNSVIKCLSKSSQIVAGCKTYEEIGGVFDCIECDTEYSKQNVVILAIGYPRCLLKTTQVVEDCQNYLVDGQGNYACGQCKQNYSLKAGVGGNICVSNNNVENNCLQYRDNGAEEECFKCQTGFTVSQVNLTTTPDKMRKKCLSNSLEVIKRCKFYQLASDGKYECTDCNTGFTKSDVKIESTTQVRCLSSTESVEDCSTYIVNQANLYVCNGCDNGYTLENSTINTVCVKSDFIEDHCIEYKDKGAIEECIKCEANYTLSVVFSGQSQSSQCLETRTKLITGCKTYELLPNQELQCKECDSAHSLQPVYETQTKFSQKCIANEDVVPECLGYAQVGLSCAHDCNSCSSGFKLAVVKIPHRITNGCLSLATEYLPFCLLHGTEHGEYYCRHGVCEKDTFSVFIGSGETQIACATDSLIEFVDDENCLYFERPRFGATELKCQKCKNGFTEPHCKPIVGYQGLTSGN